ncbi:hypothetical protein OG500_27850 [Kitasatospora sp. NBC_01250]|uniref:hypothetical protein n=1 Tax=Kitasatospora sp. NBC_01250 TaxID=2903571 RepID=UPI002E31FB90|nr:hypothetical protein [Kitasatospora sp. NBC_01250]
MGIGMLALYAALAVVALWLLAELLLQNRAPLHWRGLALGGFLLVAAGMAIHSVPVISVGALAFAGGQAMVTLSVKRGYAKGWSLRGADGSLPGPLAKVPLLSAATGGAAAVAAAAVAAEKVGEVGPIEESGQQVLPEPAVPPAAEDGDYGVYETAYESTDGSFTAGQFPDGQYTGGQFAGAQSMNGPSMDGRPVMQEQLMTPGQQQPGYGYAEQQQFDPQYGYQQQEYPGYYQEQQPYVPYEPQWQQQPYDPSQYQPDYVVPQQHIPQQQSYEYYQQPQPEAWQ